MKFGPVSVDEAEGAILAHATATEAERFKKGRVLSFADIVALKAAGITEIIVAILEPGDLGEDAAAEKIAAALRFDEIEIKPPATGRVNLHAEAAGIFTVDRALINAINRVDPSVTKV